MQSGRSEEGEGAPEVKLLDRQVAQAMGDSLQEVVGAIQPDELLHGPHSERKRFQQIVTHVQLCKNGTCCNLVWQSLQLIVIDEQDLQGWHVGDAWSHCCKQIPRNVQLPAAHPQMHFP